MKSTIAVLLALSSTFTVAANAEAMRVQPELIDVYLQTNKVLHCTDGSTVDKVKSTDIVSIDAHVIKTAKKAYSTALCNIDMNNTTKGN